MNTNEIHNLPPESPEILALSHKFADANYTGIEIVSDYMKQYKDLIIKLPSKPASAKRDDALKALWTRAYAWILSLRTLKQTAHYQAISTASRTLLETTVDILFLYADKTDKTAEKMFAFAFSEQFKAAEQIVNFFKENDETLPDEYVEQQKFYKSQLPNIQMFRNTYWQTPKQKQKQVNAEHPNRWTGQDLGSDVRKIDKICGEIIKRNLNISLGRFYRTEYRRINWHIHAGLASLHSRTGKKMPAETYDITVGISLRWCADFAFFCTQIVLTDFQYTVAISDLSDEWKRLQNYRNKVWIGIMDKD
ncbi:MAG TPA: DUF5677 domain-containing protein [Pyrinomonadaceae bacterium]|jgi:hypothetical protein